MSIIVKLELKIDPAKREAFTEAMKGMLPDTRSFEGCQGVEISENLDAPGHYVLWERWTSRDAQGKYLAWRTERGDMDQLGGFLAGEPSFAFLGYIGA